jgi:hypothetical protein
MDRSLMFLEFLVDAHKIKINVKEILALKQEIQSSTSF